MEFILCFILLPEQWKAVLDCRKFPHGFLPNTYADVTPVLEKKKAALFTHVSQDGKGIWREHHEIIAQWRGREAGVTAAEAFVHLDRHSARSKLPGN